MLEAHQVSGFYESVTLHKPCDLCRARVEYNNGWSRLSMCVPASVVSRQKRRPVAAFFVAVYTTFPGRLSKRSYALTPVANDG